MFVRHAGDVAGEIAPGVDPLRVEGAVGQCAQRRAAADIGNLEPDALFGAHAHHGDVAARAQSQRLHGSDDRQPCHDAGRAVEHIPDFVKLADAYGCVGLRCEKVEDVDSTIEKAMEVEDRPVVVDFTVHQDAMVWPMVPAGTSNDEIQVARDMAPTWDGDE